MTPSDARTHTGCGSLPVDPQPAQVDPDSALPGFQASPETRRSLARLAVSLERVGRTREALDTWRRALALAPDSASTWYGWSETLIDTFQPREALSATEHAELRWPRDPRFPLVRADAWLHAVALEELDGDERLDALRQAHAAIRRARALRRQHRIDDGELLVVEAQAALLGGDDRRAARKFRAALRLGLPLYVDRLEVSFNLGLLALRVGRPRAAALWFNRLRHLLDGWRERHYYRHIPFREYLWLVERAWMGRDDLPGSRRPPADLRDKQVYRAIREECMAIRAALQAGNRHAAHAAAERLRAAMSRKPVAACLQFAVLKKPVLFEALNRLLHEGVPRDTARH